MRPGRSKTHNVCIIVIFSKKKEIPSKNKGMVKKQPV
jgi:hypothetical protein